MRYEAFVSYARRDHAAFVAALVKRLEAAGRRVWLDRKSLPNRGLTFDHEIRLALDASERLILVVEPASLASEYVAEEWRYALSQGKPVISVLVSGSAIDVPEPLRGFQVVRAPGPDSEARLEFAAAELLRLLAEPVLPLGQTAHVPPAPPHYLSRTELVAEILDDLRTEILRPHEATVADRVVVLSGLSGSGKSSLAAELVSSVEARRSFPDGIVWVHCGPQFDPVGGAQQVLASLAPGAAQPAAGEDPAQALALGLRERDVLVVLDDLRDAAHAAPFAAALGAGGRLLVTSLDAGLATTPGAVERRVEALPQEASAQLLAEWVDGPLPAEAHIVIEESGGLPFALAVVGAMIRNGNDWATVLELFQRRELDLLEQRFPAYVHPTLRRALAAAHEALAAVDERAALCYLELSAFRPGTAIPAAALLRFWSRLGRLRDIEAKLVLPVLERWSLVQRVGGSGADRYRLHTLHEDYVRIRADDAAALEAELVDTYRAAAPDGWASLPDDGYVYDNLAFHLMNSGRHVELERLVDDDWAIAQLRRSGDHAQTLADIELALGVAAPAMHVPAVIRLGLLRGRLHSAAASMPSSLLIALARVGDGERALRWAASDPNPESRAWSLLGIADVLADHEEEVDGTARAAATECIRMIPFLGDVVESGFLPGLTSMNAVHAIVGFPAPAEWEGTSSEYVEMARAPLDVVVAVAPVLARLDALDLLDEVRHPFWTPYEMLIPRVAAAELAERGDRDPARAMLESLGEWSNDVEGLDDLEHAARYREAVAWAAAGEHERARSMIDAIPNRQYRSVGYHRLAGYLLAADRVTDAIDLVETIDDDYEATLARQDLATRAAVPPGVDAAATLQLADWLESLGNHSYLALWMRAATAEPDVAIQMVEEQTDDLVRLSLGVRVGFTLLGRGETEPAAELASRLGRWLAASGKGEWPLGFFAAEPPEWQAATAELLSLTAWSGAELPEMTVPLAGLIEVQGYSFSYRSELARDLASAGRLREAADLAESAVSPALRAAALAAAVAAASFLEAPPEHRELADRLAGYVEELSAGELGLPYLDKTVTRLSEAGLDTPAGRIVERCLDNPGSEMVLGALAAVKARSSDAEAVRRLERAVAYRRLPAAAAVRRIRLAAVCAEAWCGSGEGVAMLRWTQARLQSDSDRDLPFDVVPRFILGLADQDGITETCRWVRNLRAGLYEELAGGEVHQSEDLHGSTQGMVIAGILRASAAAGVAAALACDPPGDEPGVWAEEAVAAAAAVKELSTGAEVDVAPATALAVTGNVEEAVRQIGPQRKAVTVADRLLDLAAGNAAEDFCRSMSEELAGDELEYAGRRLGTRTIQLHDLEALGAELTRSRIGLLVRLSLNASDPVRARELADAAAALPQGSIGGLAGTIDAERAAVEAELAAALAHAGEERAAKEHIAEAVRLVREGLDEPSELLAMTMRYLLPAIVEVHGPEEAVSTWAGWLEHAGRFGIDPVLEVLTAGVRWLPDEGRPDLEPQFVGELVGMGSLDGPNGGLVLS